VLWTHPRQLAWALIAEEKKEGTKRYSSGTNRGARASREEAVSLSETVFTMTYASSNTHYCGLEAECLWAVSLLRGDMAATFVSEEDGKRHQLLAHILQLEPPYTSTALILSHPTPVH
jgi:hypothetical protein